MFGEEEEEYWRDDHPDDPHSRGAEEVSRRQVEAARERKPFSYDDAYGDYSEQAGYEDYAPVTYAQGAGVPVAGLGGGMASASAMGMVADLNSVLSEKPIETEKGPVTEYIFKDGFELDKAVVYAEIMTPKYKEY